MCVNESKTEVMYIGPETDIKSITINNKDIPLVTKIRALGITVSNTLPWEDHAINTIVKAKRCCVH